MRSEEVEADARHAVFSVGRHLPLQFILYPSFTYIYIYTLLKRIAAIMYCRSV